MTGSAIKRVDLEGPSPVEIITKKDIQRSGATSVNELIRSIPSIDVFDQGELASNSPSGSGTANLKLRGLDSSNLLILMNGRRLPVNALYDSSGAGAAFDINMIPISAIERIDILKDGASAIYGADAVAGVINIITKTDYQGIDATAGYGQASRGDAKEKRVSLSAGFGDLTKDRYNVLVGLDYFKRTPIYRADRADTASADYRSIGGTDGRSSFSPYGNIINPSTGGLVGQTYKPCPAADLNGSVCRFDFNQSVLTAYNGADRLSGLVVGTAQITPDIKAFAEVTYSKSKDLFQAQPVPDYFLVPITNPSQLPYADTVDGNPNSIYIAGRFMQGGPRMTQRNADLLNVAVGLEGTNFGLDWKASVAHGVSKVTNQDFNYYDGDLWADATNSGALDPTSTSNDPAFVAGLKVSPRRVGKSTLDTVNLQVGGEAFQLPAGPLRYAVGLSYQKEKLSDQPDQILQDGNVVGDIAQSAVSASRDAKAVYGELSVPILKNVEGQLAVRYDKYPNASATSPKVAVKYTPIPQLGLRASYTQSFRAPVLKQLYGGQEQGATTITDPAQCQKLGIALDENGECLVNAFQVNGANPNLQPEKGKTFNVGAVFDLAQGVNGSIDFWKIKKTNDITSPSLTSAIDQGLVGRDGPRLLIFTQLQNIAQLQSSGVDVDLRWRIPGTGIGNVTLRNTTTYYHSVKNRLSSGDSWDEYAGTYATPRFRNVFSAGTEFGPWNLSAALRTVGGFWDSDQPLEQIGPGARKVSNDEEVDIQGQYTGFKGFTLTAGIKNLMDRMPPLSVTNLASNTYTQLGFAELYNNRGRFLYASISYSFK